MSLQKKYVSIDEFLFDKQMSCVEFSNAIGYNYTYFLQVKNGSKRISKRMKYMIDKFTNGQLELEAQLENQESDEIPQKEDLIDKYLI